MTESGDPLYEHPMEGLPRLGPKEVHRRRELVFLILSGFFLGTLGILNVLGVSRFIDLSFSLPGLDLRIPVHLPVGVLPYPITFLCTDFVSELYGKRRANSLVWVGVALNAWLVLIFWVGGALPLLAGTDDSTFQSIRSLAFGAVTASMAAYLAAQFLDVHLFHFWKRLTKGRHLWLRNNGLTMVSQAVDSTLVILVTYSLGGLGLRDGEPPWIQLLVLIGSGYGFKLLAALLDTAPFYLGVRLFERYLRLAPAALEADAVARAQPEWAAGR